MAAKPVIAIFDVGKTNKKLFLFDEDYQLVFEKTARFTETTDEDGDPCENLSNLRLSVFDSLREVFSIKEFRVKGINFSTYGASFVYLNKDGVPLTPLYNYLKPYPETLSEQFYAAYGDAEQIAKETASPVLGSLNSGMQLYRLKQLQPNVYKQVKHALHLPQYMSFLISGEAYSDITSIGCHTQLWDFAKNDYHRWVKKEKVHAKLAPIKAADEVVTAAFPGNGYPVGVGLHDSSAALIPYLVNFHEPFILLSTGTWCISINPFNHQPLTKEELRQDCLCYFSYKGAPVKASRYFAGYEHEQQVKRIADHFQKNHLGYRNISFDRKLLPKLKPPVAQAATTGLADSGFALRDLSEFESDVHAYHQFVFDMVNRQHQATMLVLKDAPVSRIFVDGGFGKNVIYMNMLAAAFPGMEVYAASMAQASALGAALAIHPSWNSQPIPSDLIELKYYNVNGALTV
ncbi:MAG: FGGY family carbohydrate kinase [Edaphocola sp.]